MEHTYLNREFNQRDYENHAAEAVIGAAIGSVIPGVGTAVGGAVGGIVGLASSIGINFKSASSHNADHRNNIVQLWDSGKKTEAISYFTSYVNGVGREVKAHIANMVPMFNAAISSKDVTKATAFNVYYKSFLEGVGSPLSTDIMWTFSGIRFITSADIAGLVNPSGNVVQTIQPTPEPVPVPAPAPSPIPAGTDKMSTGTIVLIAAALIGGIVLFMNMKK